MAVTSTASSSCSLRLERPSTRFAGQGVGTSVVDPHFDAAPRLPRILDETAALALVAQVRKNNSSASAGGPDQPLRPPRRIRASAPVNDHIGSTRSQGQRHRSPNAARGPGNNRTQASQLAPRRFLAFQHLLNGQPQTRMSHQGRHLDKRPQDE